MSLVTDRVYVLVDPRWNMDDAPSAIEAGPPTLVVAEEVPEP